MVQKILFGGSHKRGMNRYHGTMPERLHRHSPESQGMVHSEKHEREKRF